MRKYLAILLLAAVAACSSDSSKNGNNTTKIDPNQVPAAVQGAFYSEHPYAKMNGTVQQIKTNRGAQYVIPFTRTDGSTGTATYTSYGELIKDE